MSRTKSAKGSRKEFEGIDERQVSDLRKRDVIAILSSDWHISTCPPARRDEPDWFAAMKRPLTELKRLGEYFNCPHVVGGDVFDKWNSSAELINFMLDNMPTIWAIPGQHDLPLHNYSDIKKSAYWTLVKAGKIHNLEGKETYTITENLCVSGFPWGFEITPNECECDEFIYLAVIHAYCWKAKHKYPGALDTEKVTAYKEGLAGYDSAVFGDNHIGFSASCGECEVINSGSLMRRRADQREYAPRVGLLMNDGTINEYFLDIDSDVFIEEDASLKLMAEEGIDMEELIEELNKLGDASLDYKQSIIDHVKRNKVGKEAKKILLSVLDKY